MSQLKAFTDEMWAEYAHRTLLERSQAIDRATVQREAALARITTNKDWPKERIDRAVTAKFQGDPTEFKQLVEVVGGREYLIKYHCDYCDCWVWERTDACCCLD
jgi:hypothetical protein